MWGWSFSISSLQNGKLFKRFAGLKFESGLNLASSIDTFLASFKMSLKDWEFVCGMIWFPHTLVAWKEKFQIQGNFFLGEKFI